MTSLKGWKVLTEGGGSVMDAVVQGCQEAEMDTSIPSVGYGNHPDESSEVTLDAMVFDGESHAIGAVANLRRIKSAIAVARAVLEHTDHTMLVGESATAFAKAMGFQEESLATDLSNEIWQEWRNNSCQPNYWKNVAPNPRAFCGPYVPLKQEITCDPSTKMVNEGNHDTIGMIAIDQNGHIAAGTSTNGLQFKIPGRVGDTAIPGAGAYVDKNVGAAVGTGDGDIMMRFLPSLIAVEKMREGLTPALAAKEALDRIAQIYPNASMGIVAATRQGEFGAACHNFEDFSISLVNPAVGNVLVIPVPCEANS
ncbi:unnamed protein product [Darwinula stevensoni]|uniref:N(4)-(beta-N-acetylglucosaminyl)-L-asparaginase n=1 Tax=Darwinula stevensoni TaxID=69355 RepID=A0A7R8X8W0_9CRUS|nr:unnamed protein product [Darwinula stevensoni]CAG0883837.1 unnamed protein product [Darwinula stevensoni]